jgi:hypothetical protein
MPTDLYRRAFNRAAEILGGEERLARFLYAEQNELRSWKRRQPPVEALQLVAALLMHQLLKKYGQSAIRTKIRTAKSNITNGKAPPKRGAKR